MGSGAWMGQKISAKQLKTLECVDSSCANALLVTWLSATSTHYHHKRQPILNKLYWTE